VADVFNEIIVVELVFETRHSRFDFGTVCTSMWIPEFFFFAYFQYLTDRHIAIIHLV